MTAGRGFPPWRNATRKRHIRLTRAAQPLVRRYPLTMEVLSSRILLRPSDPDRTHEFYGETLGLAVYRQFPGGTVYFLGNSLLEVSGQSDAGERPGVALWLQVRNLRSEEHTSELQSRENLV